ncbi:hypothetical protein AMAG_10588 [Allomyces macrogynus ATCC 38327]|uniref:Mitochondrial fission 1 protein n=1 Tax=Allomyces macrogynus (strain ATCC 38327) TaxID=578462 RepID=A0A0L0SQZ1_ALLM3|nr:hypothetical protein AMAG_10588 [Allomyces macrogynus ATCC 38327]|eukprot:KNE64921.1 hypothetical protein AMAG_10588 [Allomyces macrogynus ATCC 38327]
MSSQFPEADTTLPAKDLAAFRKQYEAEMPHPSADTTFNLAWGLVHSPSASDIAAGERLLLELHKTAPHLRRDVRYYLGLAAFKQAKFADARTYAEALLRDEPQNTQALALLDAVNQQVQRDGLIGMAIVGGAVAAVGLAVKILASSRR